jgi:hypothetical protein
VVYSNSLALCFEAALNPPCSSGFKFIDLRVLFKTPSISTASPFSPANLIS